jgi:hypothetical protein
VTGGWITAVVVVASETVVEGGKWEVDGAGGESVIGDRFGDGYFDFFR